MLVVQPAEESTDTGAAAMSGIAFWGAMTDGQITTVIGQLDHVMFGFGPE